MRNRVILALVLGTSHSFAEDLDAGTRVPAQEHWMAEFAQPRSTPIVHACSFRYPTCVHAERGIPSPRVLETLLAIEEFWAKAETLLALPPPDPSFETGHYDFFLMENLVSAGAPAMTKGRATGTFAREGTNFGGLDRVSAFSALLAPSGSSCERREAIAGEFARAIAWRASPAARETDARAWAKFVTHLLVPECPVLEPALGQGAAAWPTGRSMGDGAPREDADRIAALFRWVDREFSDGTGRLASPLLSLAATRSPPGRWISEPDLGDVLRETLRGALGFQTTMDDVLLKHATAQLRGGIRWTDWSIAWPAQPRRLVGGAPLSETGACRIVLSTAAARPGARLRIETEWESPAVFRWSAVRMDAQDHLLDEHPFPALQKSTNAQFTLVDLHDAAKVILVGVYAREWLTPFDPDLNHEPHGWIVNLAEE